MHRDFPRYGDLRNARWESSSCILNSDGRGTCCNGFHIPHKTKTRAFVGVVGESIAFQSLDVLHRLQNPAGQSWARMLVLLRCEKRRVENELQALLDSQKLGMKAQSPLVSAWPSLKVVNAG